MKPLITGNFLLRSKSAVYLYHEYAAPMPIIDFHNHLPPLEIAENRRFGNLARIWLGGDHYKWRAMRAAGIDEHLITGRASDREKFDAWARTVPQTLRNPLYHWTHLELARIFGIDDRLLSPETADSIWDRANDLLQQDAFCVRELLRRAGVRLLCTTDDPIDSLETHGRIADDPSFDIRVLPTFRPDKAMQLNGPFPPGGNLTVESIHEYNVYLDRLAEAAGVGISGFASLIEALRNRHQYFHDHGCRMSDHGFGQFRYRWWYDESELESIFGRVRRRDIIETKDAERLCSAILHELARMDAEKNWTMQLHIGAMRNNNSRRFREVGVDAGFDSMIDGSHALHLSRFFDNLDKEAKLPKTIVYNLNPTDNDMLATLIGNFQDGVAPGKMQYGSGWWFLDQRDGMRRQLDTISNHGLLARFVGMVTDSRSFLSFPRHEYFRRILCDLLGEEIDNGLLPNDMDLVGSMVRDICFNNAARYFGFEGLCEY
ncbi:MAG TPA: glucuronate isomerase [Planctomycetaceae bacterium]|nr:glucuronate isomerase [Planctomycetaceae bacterium]